MVHWRTPFRQPFNAYQERVRQAATARGAPEGVADSVAQHALFQEFSRQVAMLSYNEVFMILGIGACLCVPLCFLLSPIRGDGKAKGAH